MQLQASRKGPCLTDFLGGKIAKLVDDGSPVDVVNLDFQKAFDKVPHNVLFKLKAHGVGNDVLNWIEQWLTDRRQRVIVDDEISNWTVLTFAGDTKLFRKIKNYTDKHSLQDDLDKLVKWSENGTFYSILGSANTCT